MRENRTYGLMKEGRLNVLLSTLPQMFFNHQYSIDNHQSQCVPHYVALIPLIVRVTDLQMDVPVFTPRLRGNNGGREADFYPVKFSRT